MELTGINSYTSWMVALACCMINCLNLSAYRLAGLMYVEIMAYFNTNRQMASIPIILFIMIRCLGGPFIGILGQNVGFEEITLIGCFLSAVGFGCCFFAEDMLTVIILLGIVYGIGIAFGVTLLPNILKKHFTQNLNSATGIYTAGSTIGAFIFPPLGVFLLDEYGVSSTFLIVSGIILNGIPVAMLVKIARSTITKKPAKSRVLEIDKRNEEEKTMLSLLPQTLDVNHHSCTLISANNEETDIWIVSDISSTSKSVEKLGKYDKINLPHSSTDCTDAIENDKDCRQNCNRSYLKCSDQDKLCQEQKVTLMSKASRTNEQNVYSAQEFQLNTNQVNTNGGNIEINFTETTSKQMNNISDVTKAKGGRKVLRNSLRIFLEPTFIVIVVIQCSHAYVISLVWTTLIDYSRDKHIDKSNELHILMFFPITDLVGRLGLGWVTDKGYLTLSKFTAIGFLFMAVASGIIAVSKSFVEMISGVLLFALTSGALLSVMPAMVFKFMDNDQHVMGLASRAILYAPMGFTAAPLIGYFRGKLGSYDGLYYIFAGMCLMCCCITPLMSVFSKSMKKRRQKLNELT